MLEYINKLKINIVNEMNQNQALEILIKVALAAQAKGVLSLEDAVIVKQAIDLFVPANQAQPESNIVEDVESQE